MTGPRRRPRRPAAKSGKTLLVRGVGKLADVGDYNALVSATMTEDVWQAQVIKEAMEQGWMVVHYRKALRQSGGYSTPVQGHKGAPDLLMARAGVVLHVELKTDTGRLSKEQKRWRDEIGPAQWRLWRPRDRDAVWAELAASPPPPGRRAAAA
ncbi:hypothetical protein [Actinophytocola sp.]|uniref:hypothetical protein n=1 Tax=Actinophytocola sp. TaxID=1872138 RepID=UPI002D763E8B|nr:hypothetical protein [Actinophytocola sp.]HYQ69087.1 hypothetical protein [Actinophytocola sp.]